jgi:hypothetical protein
MTTVATGIRRGGKGCGLRALAASYPARVKRTASAIIENFVFMAISSFSVAPKSVVQWCEPVPPTWIKLSEPTLARPFIRHSSAAISRQSSQSFLG